MCEMQYPSLMIDKAGALRQQFHTGHSPLQRSQVAILAGRDESSKLSANANLYFQM